MSLSLSVLHLAHDNPKRNTARKLAKFGLVDLVDKPQYAPRGAILLDPFAEHALSRADLHIAEKHGLVALDCSWRRAEEVFPPLRKRTVPRALPFLLASNPINFGRAWILSTAEALAASCTILGEREQAEFLMSKFMWGKHFFTLNEEPLKDYAAASSSAEVVAAQDAFLPDEDEDAGGEEE